MKFSHSVKFPLGKRYEMHDFYMEMDDSEFPELEGRPLVEKARYMQGTLLQLSLVFQAASGYVSPDDEDFKAQLRLAHELKKLSLRSVKVVPNETASPFAKF